MKYMTLSAFLYLQLILIFIGACSIPTETARPTSSETENMITIAVVLSDSTPASNATMKLISITTWETATLARVSPIGRIYQADSNGIISLSKDSISLHSVNETNTSEWTVLIEGSNEALLFDYKAFTTDTLISTAPYKQLNGYLITPEQTNTQVCLYSTPYCARLDSSNNFSFDAIPSGTYTPYILEIDSNTLHIIENTQLVPQDTFVVDSVFYKNTHNYLTITHSSGDTLAGIGIQVLTMDTWLQNINKGIPIATTTLFTDSLGRIDITENNIIHQYLFYSDSAIGFYHYFQNVSVLQTDSLTTYTGNLIAPSSSIIKICLYATPYCSDVDAQGDFTFPSIVQGIYWAYVLDSNDTTFVAVPDLAITADASTDRDTLYYSPVF